MKKLFIIPALLGAMMFTSCQDFLDVNYTKDSPTTTTVDQVLPVATFYASQLCYDHAEYGVYMSQALTTGGKSQTGSYPYSQGWEFLGVNRHPMWRRHFYDLGANIHKMNEIAGYKRVGTSDKYEVDWDANPKCNAILIGRTIMLASTLFTTDAFGDMPRSEVYIPGKASPKYDTQAEVYDWMFREADELLRLYDDPDWVNCPTNLVISEKMDRIYKGDMNKWKLYCKAIRARLWLRKLPNWDNTVANCNKIIAMVDEVLNDANWEEPRYYYPGGVTESNCPWGPARPKINSWESRDNRLNQSVPTTFFLHGILGSYDKAYQATRGYALDPRADRIMEQPDKEKNKPMLHLESNIGMDIQYTVANYPNLYTESKLTNPFTQNTGYIALITTEELQFIKAEAQFWAGDTKGAYETTKAAVKHNMKERYGLDGDQIERAYIAHNKKASERTEEEKALVKVIGKNLANQYNRYMQFKLPGESKFTIADVMQQKYVAMYLQPEQWTDMRRYNYSSSKNGISYTRAGEKPTFVYDVYYVHNGKNAQFAKDSANFFDSKGNPLSYSLRRPYNLYEAYWDTPENYGVNAELSPNAWVNRLNADTETETKYNKKELERMGYYAKDADGNFILDAQGNKVLDYHILKKRMIWAYNTCGMAQSSDPGIKWD